MLILAATTDLLQVVLAATVATSQLQCYASWRDVTTSAYTPGLTASLTNNTSDVSVVPAPGASTQRVVDYLSVYNSDTASATVTLKYDASGTEKILWSGVLLASEKVEYVDGMGWRTFAADGTAKGYGTTGATGAAGTPGGGTILGVGTATLDFGAFPGADEAQLVVTGLPLILAGSTVYCWIKPEATPDHDVDDHILVMFKVFARDVVAATGFTIHAMNTNQLFERARSALSLLERAAANTGGRGVQDKQPQKLYSKRDPMIWGRWSIGYFYTQ